MPHYSLGLSALQRSCGTLIPYTSCHGGQRVRSEELEAPSDLDTLRKRCDTGIDGVAFGLKTLAFGPQMRQLDVEDLDELALLELRLGVLVLGQLRIDVDVHHAQVGVAETGVYGSVRCQCRALMLRIED